MKLLDVATTLIAIGIVACPVAAQSSQPTFIVVQNDHYARASTTFNDLDELERTVRAAKVQAVVLQICGAQASRSLRAASHRFAELPQRLQVLGPELPECSARPQMMRVSQSTRSGPSGIDDALVERYWQQLMP